MIEVIDHGKDSALTHMARDRQMLSRGTSYSQLSFYKWNSFCVTYGLFAHPEDFLKMDFCEVQGIEVVQRPTGGGIFFHEFDFPFSLFFPVDHLFPSGSFEAAWAKIQESMINKLASTLEDVSQSELHSHPIKGRFCQAQAHECDFVWGKKKFGGAAFRKSKHGILCQASLFCTPFSWEKRVLCVKESNILHVMKQICVPLKRDEKHLQKVITRAIEENL